MNHNLETITLKNQIINLATPKDFNPNKNYRLYFVFDGKELLTNSEANILTSSPTDIIFIGVNNLNNADRFNNFSTFTNQQVKKIMSKYFPDLNNSQIDYLGGQGQVTINFIENDLLPWLKNEKKINYLNLNLLGCSMGSYFSLQMLYLSKLSFNTVYLFSPSIWFNQNIIQDLKNYQLNHNQKFKINLWVGLKEPKLFEKTITTNYYQATLQVKEILEKKQQKINFFVEANGGHGFKWWITFINYHPELY